MKSSTFPQQQSDNIGIKSVMSPSDTVDLESPLIWIQGYSGAGTRGNGVPIPFSRFALK